MPAAPQKPPGFFVDRHYLKDLSFENPAGPMQIADRSQIKSRVGGAVNSQAMEKAGFFKVDTTLTINASIADRTIFLCELTYSADVELTQIPDQVRKQILSVDVPNYLMPHINQVIDHVARAGGFTELRIKKIDFLALYTNALRKKAQAGTADGTS